MKSIFLSENPKSILSVYSGAVTAELCECAGLDTDVLSKSDILAGKAADAEYIFATWGMPRFTKEEIREHLPSLKALFYAAGSVQGFAREFMESGVKVFSAWAANAVPVAEYTVAQITLANKGFFRAAALASVGQRKEAAAFVNNCKGNYGCAVGIIGAGMIGRLVIKMLTSYDITVKVFDAFMSQEEAEKLGVALCSLAEIFSTCTVISNHLANNEHTAGMLGYEHFSLMNDYATFINTGRGAQVVEADLIKAMKEKPSCTALLDVTYPEPPVRESELYRLDNIILTPHIAGSIGNEVHRMGVYMLEEYRLLASGKPTNYEVTLKMLETMA